MKKVLFLILFLILVLPTVWQTFLPGYFSMHDDLQVMRIFQMEKCLQDGQIPCRWAPDMAYGFGQPMFNFYSAFPYYLGILIKLLTSISIISSVKALFFIAIFASGIGMFLLSRKFFGFWGGLVSAIFYVYAPYHALDIYVRGALSESFALAILPFLWLFLYELIKEAKTKNIIAFALTLAALLTTHNLSTMIYAVFTSIWAIFWLVVEKKNLFKNIISLGVAGSLGVAMASFFIVPVFMEKPLIQSEFLSMNYLNYENHFVSLRQLFLDRSWGHGPSIFGDTDDISFQIGIVHWIVAFLVGLSLVKDLALRKFNSKTFMLVLLFALLGLNTFLTHSKSLFIWKSIEETMLFVQFPWRFLGPVIFFISLIAGASIPDIKVVKAYIASTLIIIVIILNYNYFKPLYYFPEETDQTKLSGELFIIQSKSAILDYLPRTAKMAPEHQAGQPSVSEGEGQISNYTVRSNYFFFDAEMYTDGTVDIPVTYYPGWVVLDRETEISTRPDGMLGTIYIDLDEGKHLIRGRFTETPLRRNANLVTLAGFVGVLLLYIFKDKTDKWLS